jgi:chaperonin cofactor prefoldin
LRNIGGKSIGYAIHSRARKPASPGTGLVAPASDADKLHAAVTAEVETLRLRVRSLTATNTNLRRRVRNLESQHAAKAASA